MLLPNSKIFLYSCLFFIFGVGAVSFLALKFSSTVFCAAVSAVLVLLSAGIVRRSRAFIAIGLWSFLFIMGAGRYAYYGQEKERPDAINRLNGQKIDFIGMVARDPEEKISSQKLIIQAEQTVSDHRLLSGRVAVSASQFPRYAYGDRLKISCQLKKPEPIEDFAYDRYLARHNIYSTCGYPKIELRQSGQGRKAMSWLLAVKHKLKTAINSSLAEPAAALAVGMTLGDSGLIPENVQNDFSRTGLSHIVAISGMNISLSAVVLMEVLIFICFRRQTAFYLATLILAGYIALIGAPASAVRAGIMSFIMFWALTFGRLSRPLNALALAGAIMLAGNPRLLRDDGGFQLSFLATAGILYYYPGFLSLMESWPGLGRWPEFFKAAIGVTLTASILTLPLIAYNFQIISIISPFANLAGVWLLPFIMAGTFLAGAMTAVWPLAGVWLFAPVQLMLSYLANLAEVMARFPGSYINPGRFSARLLIFYYLFVLSASIWIFQRQKNKLIIKNMDK